MGNNLGSDRGKGKDNVAVRICNFCDEKGKMKASWRIDKFKTPDKAKGLAPYAVDEWDFNLLLNEGINNFLTVLCSAGGTKYDNGNAFLGVGDDNTAAAAAQTGLQAAVNKIYVAMEVGYPTYGTSQLAVWKSSFADGVAEWAWEEFALSNSNSDSGDLLNRKVTPKGTKLAGDVWDLTLTITFS